MLPLRILGVRGRVRLLHPSSSSCSHSHSPINNTTPSATIPYSQRYFSNTLLSQKEASTTKKSSLPTATPFRIRRRTPASISKYNLNQSLKRTPRYDPRQVPEQLNTQSSSSSNNQNKTNNKSTDPSTQYQISPHPNAPSKNKFRNEPDPQTALAYFQHLQNEHGSTHPSNIINAESMMRAADYITSDPGTTEDLVGERRVLSSNTNNWSKEEQLNFKTNLEDFVKSQEGKEWNVGRWWEEEEIKKEEEEWVERNKNRKEISGAPMEPGDEDPNRKAHGPWSETIIRVDRVQKVQRGGTMVRYRALVIGGNLNGCAGFGVAKANTPQQASFAAARMARTNIFFIDRYEGAGLTFDLAGKHNSCKVALRAVDPHRGLKGHPLIVEILKYFGIADCSCKSHGNRNVYNVVRATFKAIMTHESLEDIALKRGKRLMYLERAKRLGISA